MLFQNLSKSSTKLALILSVAACLAQTTAEWDTARVNGIAQKLRCPCGCNLPMSCQMPPHPCPTCKNNRIRIYNLLTRGLTEQQILDQYVKEEGTRTLWVTPGGFGKAAPYGVLAAGCGVVLFVIRRHLRTGTAQPALDGTTLEQVKKELSEFDR